MRHVLHPNPSLDALLEGASQSAAFVIGLVVTSDVFVVTLKMLVMLTMMVTTYVREWRKHDPQKLLVHKSVTIGHLQSDRQARPADQPSLATQALSDWPAPPPHSDVEATKSSVHYVRTCSHCQTVASQDCRAQIHSARRDPRSETTEASASLQYHHRRPNLSCSDTRV